jgi:hypothetical protein
VSYPLPLHVEHMWPGTCRYVFELARTKGRVTASRSGNALTLTANWAFRSRESKSTWAVAWGPLPFGARLTAMRFWVVLLLTMAAGCGRSRCDASTCQGCCEATGVCREVSANTCGANGSICRGCGAGFQCIAGSCAAATGTGGAAGAGTAGVGGQLGGMAGTGGGGSSGLGGGTGSGGATGDACSVESKLVYFVDNTNGFWSFDPSRFGQPSAVTQVGTLSCPTDDGSPFSMAIDRNAVAWVNYDSAELFRVDIKSSLSCTATSFMPQQNIGRFGMGFATAGAGSTTDALYIAGQPPGGLGPAGDARFGTLSVPGPHTINIVGDLMGTPELSGTGDGHLWGFVPGSAPAIREYDKRSGAVLKSLPVPSLAGTPRGWAFAFWGGQFFVFLIKNAETSSSIYRFDAMGQPMGRMNTTRLIVGAGVSTCAPIEIQ